MTSYTNINISDLLDMILNGDDEAMYYLLHDHLNHQLHERFISYQRHLYDNYEDIIDDFFLYLRESGDYPCQSLRRIKKKEGFDSWILNTFRNYLSNRAEKERIIINTELECDHLLTDDTTVISEEERIAIVSQLIAYSLQVFYPRGRFIFLRSLLTMLNNQRAVPNEEMAKALDMTYLAYRVSLHHMKQNAKKFRDQLLNGETLRLDSEHQQIANSINNNFANLYPTLFNYYLQCIDTLKASTAIKHLRQHYLEEQGFAVHEPDTESSVRINITSLWVKLNRWLLL